MAIQIQLRRGTLVQWSFANTVLAAGELGLEIDTGFVKIGDGVSNWTDLNYMTSGVANNALYLNGVAASDYQTTTGLSANVAKLTANNTSYVGSVTAVNVVSNAQLQANLANYTNTAGLSSYISGSVANNAYNLGGLSPSSYQTVSGLSTAVAARTANNTTFVGDIPAANVVSYGQLLDTLSNYQTTAGLASNVAILAANSATYLNGNTANDLNTYATNRAANAYSNAISYASNASNISNGTLAEARLPYRLDQNLRTSDSVQFANLTVNSLLISGNVTVIGSNNLSVTDNMIYLNANSDVNNPDLGFAGNYNDGTYHHAGFFRDASDGVWKVFDNYQPEPDASQYINTSNSTFHIANFQANIVYIGNTSTYASINSTSYTGSANNASYLQGNTVTDLNNYADDAANAAYSNAVSRIDSQVSTSYNNALTVTLSRNGTYTGNNTFAGTFLKVDSNLLVNTNVTTTFGDPSNNEKTIALSSNLINSGGQEWGAAISIGASGAGPYNKDYTPQGGLWAVAANIFFVNTSIMQFGNSTFYSNLHGGKITFNSSGGSATINATTFTGTANNATYLGGTAANAYQTAAGLSANVINLIANNVLYVHDIAAANVVSNAQLIANLANYQTTAGLSANVATLTANNTSYVGSVAAFNVVSNAQLQSNLANYQLTANLGAAVSFLTANNASFLNGIAANAYVNTSGAYTITGVHSHTANISVNAAIIAGDNAGSPGQVLTSNGSSNVYWSTLASNLTVRSTAGNNGTVNTVVTNVTGINFDETTGFNITDQGSGNVFVSLGSGYKYITVSGQTTITAVGEDTLNVANGNYIYLTTSNSAPKTLTISANLSAFQTTAGLSANVATMTANNTSFVGTVSAANVVSNAQLQANLTYIANNITQLRNGNNSNDYANYLSLDSNGSVHIAQDSDTTSAKLIFDGANSAIYEHSNPDEFTPAKGLVIKPPTNISTVTIDNSDSQAIVTPGWGATLLLLNTTLTFNDNTVQSTAFKTNTAYTFTAVHTHTANLVVNAAIIAGGNSGTAGQVLTSNGSGNAYWSTPVTTSVNVAAQYVWSNTQTFTNTITFSSVIDGTVNNSNNLNGKTESNLNVNSAASALNANNSSYLGGNTASDLNTYANTKANTAYSNAVSYVDSKIGTANSAITSNAATAYTNATAYASNATNISSGTVAEARLPYRMNQNVTTTNNVTFANLTITGGTVATTPTYSTDIVNKQYVDGLASGVNYHPAVRLTTNTELTPVTYNNGTDGVGATLTKSSSYSALSVDSISVAHQDRILVKNQSNNVLNGIYFVSNTGSGSYPWILTRALDYDLVGTGTNEIAKGDIIYVLEGTLGAGTAWVENSDVTAIGTDAITFVQFSSKALYALSSGSGLYYSTGGSYDGSAASTLAVNTAYIETLAANNASYLGTVAAASYVQNTDSRTLSGNLNFTGANSYFGGKVTLASNLVISTGISVIDSTGTQGTAGQVLTSNGSGNVYWSTVTGGGGGGFTNGQSISVSNLEITSALFANGSSNTGTAGQILTSNGNGVYWGNNVPQPVNVRQSYTADGSTSTFTVSGGYVPYNLDVYLNGVKLQNSTEVSVSSGSTFTINSGSPASGAVIEVVGGTISGLTIAVPYTASSTNSITVNPAAYSGYFITALATTLNINASTAGSPVNGTRMIFRLKDNGTQRTINWTTSGAGSFRVIGATLPTTTVQSKVIYVACIYNADEQFWDVLATGIQA